MLCPPWRERLADGRLGPEYGPRTATTFARHVAKHRDWSYQAPKEPSTRAGDAEMLAGFMRSGAAVPDSERQTYALVIEQGNSIRAAAKVLGLSRESVRSYLGRLKARAAKALG